MQKFINPSAHVARERWSHDKLPSALPLVSDTSMKIVTSMDSLNWKAHKVNGGLKCS